MKKNFLFFALGGLLLTSAGLTSCEYLVKEEAQSEEEVVKDDVETTKSSTGDAIESNDAEGIDSSPGLDETQNSASGEGVEAQDASQEAPSE
tara:strand:+ start:1697 stop:1972 length:276 start_codon:yes stop_codon:yes gene_type:complete